MSKDEAMRSSLYETPTLRASAGKVSPIASATTAPPIARNHGVSVRVFIAVGCLLSVYVDPAIEVTIEGMSVLVPSFVATLIVVPLMALVAWHEVRSAEISAASWLLAVFAVSIALSPGLEFVSEKMLGLVQVAVSLATAVLFASLMRRVPPRTIAATFGGFAAMLLVLAALEVLGVTRDASDTFRAMAYGVDGGLVHDIYEADARDQVLVGHTRPKVFTAEPSYVVVAYMVFANACLLVIPTRRRALVVAAGAVILLGLTASPIVYGSLLLTIAITQWKRAPMTTLVASLGCLALGMLVVSLLFPGVSGRAQERVTSAWHHLGSETLTSENIRLAFPARTAIDVISQAPAFGVGLSGKEVLPRFTTLPYEPAVTLGTNNLAAMFIYLGLIGTTTTVWACRRYACLTGMPQPGLVAAFIGVIAMSMGGFETSRWWVYVAVVVVAAEASHRNFTAKRAIVTQPTATVATTQRAIRS